MFQKFAATQSRDSGDWWAGWGLVFSTAASNAPVPLGCCRDSGQWRFVAV